MLPALLFPVPFFYLKHENVLFPGIFVVLRKTGKSKENGTEIQKLGNIDLLWMLQEFQKFLDFVLTKTVVDFHYFESHG